MNKRYLANCNFPYYYFPQVFVSVTVLGVGLHSVFFSRLDIFLLCNPVKCNNCSTGLCQYNYNLLFVSLVDSIFTHGVRCAHVTPVRYLNLPGRFFVQMNALSP
jgi:hypothetical protein